jgi:tetratricopeptide (TPR) repeat protein
MVLLALIGACAPPADPPRVLHSGCEHVTAEGACVPDRGELRLWVDAPSDEVTAGGLGTHSASPVEGGTLVVVTGIEGAGEVRVRAGGTWRMPIADSPWVAAPEVSLDEARAHDGDAGIQARMRAARLRMMSEPEVAVALLDEVASLAEASGLARAATLARVRSHWLRVYELGEPMPSEPPLAMPPVSDDGWIRHVAAMSLGVWAAETGRYRDAMAWADEAQYLDDRGGRRAAWRVAQLQADIQEALGHTDGARRILAPFLTTADPCTLPWVHLAVGDVAVSAAESGGDTGGLVGLAEQTLAAMEVEDCWMPTHLREDALVDLARAGIAEGDWERVREALADYQPSEARVRTRTYGARARALLALHDGAPAEALRLLDEARATLEGAGPLDQLHLDAVRTRAFLAADAAKDARRAALTLVDDTLRLGPLIPLHRGRAAYYAWSERVLAETLPLLVEGGELDRAWQTIARVRGAYVAHLRIADLPDTGADTGWQTARAGLSALWETRLSLERQLSLAAADEVAALRARVDAVDAEMAALADDAFRDVVAPTGEPGVPQLTTVDRYVFLRDANGVVRVAASVEPFAETLRAAAWVEIPHGQVQRDRLDRLTLDGAPLDEAIPVAWTLGGAPRAPVVPATAAVVSDPDGSLVAARSEGDAVAAQLAARGLTVERLAGTAATVDAVRDAFESADLLHFAGHASFGRGPWDARLVLADGYLDLRAVLALESVPDLVVLAGCETARSTTTRVTDLGLAQALLLRGADAVVGTTREVDSDLAGRLARAFHDALADSPPPVAMHRALAELRSADPTADTSAFRLLLP